MMNPAKVLVCMHVLYVMRVKRSLVQIHRCISLFTSVHILVNFHRANTETCIPELMPYTCTCHTCTHVHTQESLLYLGGSTLLRRRRRKCIGQRSKT